MDAKVDDWVVTPRRGKAVEINALWYNALRLLEGWLQEEGRSRRVRQVREAADRARDSFNRRFWFEAGGYLYDVVDAESGGDDASCRPNQVLAISLDHPVLDESRWERGDGRGHRAAADAGGSAVAGARAVRITKRNTMATCASRDAAYHQGTVWAWLIGPYIDAWLKLHPGRAGQGARVPRQASRRIWTSSASARSARSSTPRRRTRRAAASRRRGAWRRCCAAG